MSTRSGYLAPPFDERGQVDAAYLLKVIVLALVAVLIVAVLFGAVPPLDV